VRVGFKRREVCEHWKRREVPHGTGTQITGSSLRVSAFRVVSREGHVVDEASLNHVTIACQDTNGYAAVKIEETLFMCNVYEWDRSYDRMNVVDILRYWYIVRF
jgi:hypothetical protein